MLQSGGAMNTANDSYRVGIADNDPVTGKTFAMILPRLAPGLQVAWVVTSGKEAIRRCLNEEYAPDLLVLDMSLGSEENGVDITYLLRSETEAVDILGITSYPLQAYGADLAAAGAQGLVPKAHNRMLAEAIAAIRAGRTYSPLPDIHFDDAHTCNRRIVREPRPQAPLLSSQEEKVLNYLVQGRNYAQIAELSGVTESTVRTQIARAIAKLKANTLSEAVAIWVTKAWK